jgi:6-pyruvoyltetrahydropterin/6-carboxytetrahydropterin synthase
MPRARVTKRVQFAAGHHLSCPEFSEEENRRVFGDCRNLHGHNYDLEVTVEGEVDPSTGFVIELGELKERLHGLVVDEIDHRTLNDVPLMEGLNPTVENLAVRIWGRLEGQLASLTLISVKLWETDRNIAEYRGG